MRTDGKLTYKDIKARMTAQSEELPKENTLNMRREREARGPLGLSCWTNTRTCITKVELKRIEGLTIDQVALNTTMNVEYQRKGPRELIPTRLRSKTLTNAPPRYYDVGFFLDLELGETIHTPSPRIKEAIKLFHELSRAARGQGLKSWECVYPEAPTRVPKRQRVNVAAVLDKNSNVKRIRRSRMLRLDEQLNAYEATDSDVERTIDEDDDFDAQSVSTTQPRIFSNVAAEKDEHVAFSGLPRLGKNHEYVEGQSVLDRSEAMAIRSSTRRGSTDHKSVLSTQTSINHTRERFDESATIRSNPYSMGPPDRRQWNEHAYQLRGRQS